LHRARQPSHGLVSCIRAMVSGCARRRANDAGAAFRAPLLAEVALLWRLTRVGTQGR